MRYSVAFVGDCARAEAAHTATISEARTARTAAVENMWTNSGKLVDILTCREFFFAHCSDKPRRAACGCVFADCFACALRTGHAECSAGLPPRFMVFVSYRAACRSPFIAS